MQHPTAEHPEIPGQESEVTLAPWLRELKQRVRSHAAEHLTSRLQKRDCAVCLPATSLFPQRELVDVAEQTVTVPSDAASDFSTEPKSVSFGVPFRYDVTLRGILDLFHIENFSNASEEEVTFFFELHFDLCTAAGKLARESNGGADRAYQAVLSALYKESAIISPPERLTR